MDFTDPLQRDVCTNGINGDAISPILPEYDGYM